MTGIVVTSDVDFVEITFNDYADNWENAKVKRTSAQRVQWQTNNGGVDIVWLDGEIFNFPTYTIVDGIDGVVPTSDEDLYDKLKALMK